MNKSYVPMQTRVGNRKQAEPMKGPTSFRRGLTVAGGCDRHSFK